MKKLMLAVVAIATMLCGIAQAEESNDLWMVSGRGAMLAYAKRSVSGSVGFWSISSVGESSVTNYAYVNLTGDGDVFKVIAGLKTQEVSISVARATDRVGISESINTKEGWSILSGYNYGYLEKNSKGDWVVPPSLLIVKLRLNYQSPIYIKGAVSAKIITRDENGNVVDTSNLDVYNGIVLFPNQFLGRNGELAVTVDQGGGRYTTVVGDLRDNKKTDVVTVSAKVDSLIDGLIILPDDSAYFDVMPESNEGHGESPLICGKFTKSMTFLLHAKTTEGQVARGVWYRQDGADSGDWQYSPVSQAVGCAEIQIVKPDGYDFVIDWDGFDDQIYHWYNYGGGGGGLVVVGEG
ncbi:MAG: hypothetical protein WCP24_01590 [bacterium]